MIQNPKFTEYARHELKGVFEILYFRYGVIEESGLLETSETAYTAMQHHIPEDSLIQ